MKERIELVQQELNKRNLYSGIVDGLLNDATLAALESLLPLYDKIRPEWTPIRKAYGFLQITCLENGFNPGDIDGKWGPNTEYAFNSYQYFLVNQKTPDPWRPEDILPVNPNNWPVQYTPEFDAFYGPKGSSLVKIQLPYSIKIAWDPAITINTFSCHAKVHDSILRVLTNVLNHYGIAEIRRLRLDMWGGCYNERPIRGGTKWSMHSWAIAIDFDPMLNKLEWGRDKAAFAGPEYDKWWECWEEEGWVSLGRLRNFDWMHVQAAKL